MSFFRKKVDRSPQKMVELDTRHCQNCHREYLRGYREMWEIMTGRTQGGDFLPSNNIVEAWKGFNRLDTDLDEILKHKGVE